MNRTVTIMVGSLLLLVALLVLMARNDSPGPLRDASGELESGRPLMLYCAASNRAVMEAIRADYTTEFGRAIQIQYGPSQTLLSSMEVSGSGDLYLPADDSFLNIAKSKDLIAEVLPIARMQGVVAVQRSNPKSIQHYSDLLRDDVRLVQANPDAAAIGKLTRSILKEQNRWAALERGTTAFRTTVTDVANDIVVGAADAGIVYDAVLHTYPEVDFIELPELMPAASQVSIGVISGTTQPQAALHFARYVTARDRGLTHYAEHGFRVADGDQWSDSPELSVFAGSMLRPAIEDAICDFEKREGIQVSRIYNGCGILVAQMKSGNRPDIFFACDTEFMRQVPELFPDSIDVSQNELVILVRKGNPLGIKRLADLAQEKLRVGVGHEKQCAMGWLTKETLRASGVLSEVMANVTVQTPTGDMLVNQMRTGSLDAAIVYLSNVANGNDTLEAVRINGIQEAVATQPLAIAPESPFAETARRLFRRIGNAESKATFESEGFRWRLGSDDKVDHERQ